MSKEKQVEKPSVVIPMSKADVISIVVVGVLTGIAVWGFGGLLYRFVFDAFLCNGELSSQCNLSAKNYAAAIAGLIGAALALGGLIRLRVYRPLLIIIAAMLSLWGVVQISWEYSWFIGIAISMLLYGLAFGLFAWISRIREFWISLVVTVLLIIAVRVALLA